MNCELTLVNSKDKQAYLKMKKLSEETEQTPSELKPH